MSLFPTSFVYSFFRETEFTHGPDLLSQPAWTLSKLSSPEETVDETCLE
ncbi:hypothetical protein E2C01_082894 [Portunus trituberculatus]|uniref:Uncharacterized protein n=1 Tax=Portunus trituberculatus TaxID=210409 RepID=A0A5B7IZP2_PORTR|nr:hypothetical protein [Portunus trituberculatus]